MRLLKETADQISPSLTMLFNKSLRLGIFPGDWKLANIVPIFKKGKKDFVENYRPISIGKRELAITLAAREYTSFWQISRLVPFILTGTQATGYSSRSQPQGSLLGPILFLLFVDDLPNTVKTSRVACYADDTKIFKSIDSITDCNALQSDLNDLVSWSESSGLIFNQSKCKYQFITRKKSPVQPTYNINETPLECCDTEKDLGVWVSSNLTSDKQVTEQRAKANKLLGFVRRASRYIQSIQTRRTLYLSIVRCHLGYATQVWSPESIGLLRRVENVQRRATKLILKLPFRCDVTYKTRLQLTNLLPIILA